MIVYSLHFEDYHWWMSEKNYSPPDSNRVIKSQYFTYCSLNGKRKISDSYKEAFSGLHKSITDMTFLNEAKANVCKVKCPTQTNGSNDCAFYVVAFINARLLMVDTRNRKNFTKVWPGSDSTVDRKAFLDALLKPEYTSHSS